MIDDLCSPDTSDTRLGERASANVTPCNDNDNDNDNDNNNNSLITYIALF